MDSNGRHGDIWGTTVRNKDEELKTFFWDLWFFGNIVWGVTRGGCEAYLLTSLCDLPLLFVYFQVNNGVLYFLDYVEDIYIMNGPLCSRFNVVTSASQPM